MYLRIRLALAISLLITSLAPGSAIAHEPEGPGQAMVNLQKATPEKGGEIPEQVGREHWAYREMTELIKKYSAGKKLPEGRNCSRTEMAECLLAVLDRGLSKG